MVSGRVLNPAFTALGDYGHVLAQVAEGDPILPRATPSGAQLAEAAEAGDERGRVYLGLVKRRQHRFIENLDAPPAWAYFWRRGMQIETREWPWLSSPGHSVRYRTSAR